jgi:hypothetical protein
MLGPDSASRGEARKKSLRKVHDSEESRRKRQDQVMNLRKESREAQLQKKRNVVWSPDAPEPVLTLGPRVRGPRPRVRVCARCARVCVF